MCHVEELALPTRAIQLSGEVLSTDEATTAELREAEAAHQACNSRHLHKAATWCRSRVQSLYHGSSGSGTHWQTMGRSGWHRTKQSRRSSETWTMSQDGFLDHSQWIVAGLGLGTVFIAILLFTNMGVMGQALKKVGSALLVQFIHSSFQCHFPRWHLDKEELMNRFTHAFKDAASTAVNLLVKTDELQALMSTGSATTGV